jgi:hypothetical protein
MKQSETLTKNLNLKWPGYLQSYKLGGGGATELVNAKSTIHIFTTEKHVKFYVTCQ